MQFVVIVVVLISLSFRTGFPPVCMWLGTCFLFFFRVCCRVVVLLFIAISSRVSGLRATVVSSLISGVDLYFAFFFLFSLV